MNENMMRACIKTNQELNSIEHDVIDLSIKTINKIKRDCVVIYNFLITRVYFSIRFLLI